MNRAWLGLSVLSAMFVFTASVADFVPSNPKEMVPLKNRNSAAHQALKHFQRGANLGHYLEAPKGQSWGARYTEADFQHIKAEGFDHVRLPIRWNDYAGAAPDFKLTDEIYAMADFLVTNATTRGLSVIVKAKTPLLGPIYARAIKVISETNPGRTIFLGPGKWNNVDELKDLVLSADDEHLVVTVHCYEPFLFTHQGATWAGKQTRTKGVVFPGPPSTPLAPVPVAVQSASWVSNWFKNYNTKPTAENPVSAKIIEEKMKRAHDWG